MHELHTCPHGHEWEAVSATADTGILPSVACPICGAAPVTLSVAVGPDQTQLHEGADSEARGAGEAAILPDPKTLALGWPGQLAAPGTPQRYQPLRLHAKGGLGEVFVARDGELNREVALKRIQADHAHRPDSLRRFLVEAEVTGRLEHPGIVPVYGLGRDADGQPCYAMRLVQGETLQEAIRSFHESAIGDRPSAVGQNATVEPTAESRKPIAERRKPMADSERRLAFRNLLTRFVSVCYTMAYAHSRGILHRDLKPANIMLGKFGETLIVDWGLAKPFERTEQGREAGDTTLLPTGYPDQAATLTGAALGTPAYMSPEQAEGRGDEALQASDIYGLGATLYTLLTGEPPFHSKQVADVLQQVRRGEFLHPRQVKPDTPRPLEAICLKAMALRAADRYATALDLAADLEHWLADEPVRAWREPWTVTARRWISRHRTLVAGLGAAAVAAVLILSAVTAFLTAAWDSERLAKELAQRQEREAERQRDDAARQRDRAAKNAQRARDAVDQMLTQVADEQLRHVRGMEPVRQALLEKALAFYLEFLKEKDDDPDMRREAARAHFRVGDINKLMGRHEEAQTAYRQALQVLDKLVADFPNQPAYRYDLAQALNNLGNSLTTTRAIKEAEQAFQRAIEINQQLVKEFPKALEYRIDLGTHHGNLGNLYVHSDRPEDAEKHLQKSLQIREEVLRIDPNRPDLQHQLVMAYINLAVLQDRVTRWQKGEQLYAKALPIMEPLARKYPGYAPYQADLSKVFSNLAITYRNTNRPTEAEATYQKALPIRERLAREHPHVPAYQAELADLHNNLGVLYDSTNRVAEAEAAWQRSANIRGQLARDYPAVPEYQEKLADVLEKLAPVYSRTNRPKPAETAYRRAVDTREKLAAGHPTLPRYQEDWAWSLGHLGGFYLNSGRAPDGEALYQKALAVLEQLARDHAREQRFTISLAGICGNFGNALRDSGRPAEALERYVQAISKLEPLLPREPADPRTRGFLRNLYHSQAQMLGRLQRHDEALPAWDRAIALDDGRPATFYRVQRAHTLVRLGKHAQAVQEADELTKTKASGSTLYDVASVYALAVPVVRKDAQLAEADRGPQAERHAQRALERLGQARQSGFFRAAANVARLKKDGDWDALSARPEFRDFVAGLDDDLGNAHHRAANQSKQAEAAYQVALEAREQLVREQPKEPRYQNSLAATLNNLGRFYKDTARLTEAEAAYQRAAVIREQLVRDHPEAPAYRNGLRLSLNGLGIVCKETNRPREAEAAYRKALEIQEALVRDHPEVAEYAVGLGGVYSNLGLLFRDNDQAVVALEWYAKAEKTLSGLAATDSPPALAREFLGNTYSGRAGALTRLERDADALKDWERAIEFSERDATWLQVQRARTRARLGEHRLAADEIKTLSEKLPQSTNGQLWYDLACASALAASAAGKDGALPQAERDRLAEQHAARAVELLVKARVAGHFKPASNYEMLTKEKDLDPLRARADFLKLVRDP